MFLTWWPLGLIVFKTDTNSHRFVVLWQPLCGPWNYYIDSKFYIKRLWVDANVQMRTRTQPLVLSPIFATRLFSTSELGSRFSYNVQEKCSHLCIKCVYMHINVKTKENCAHYLTRWCILYLCVFCLMFTCIVNWWDIISLYIISDYILRTYGKKYFDQVLVKLRFVTTMIYITCISLTCNTDKNHYISFIINSSQISFLCSLFNFERFHIGAFTSKNVNFIVVRTHKMPLLRGNLWSPKASRFYFIFFMIKPQILSLQN